MYLNAEITKMYHSGIAPRIAAKLIGWSVGLVIRQYGKLAKLAESTAVHNAYDLRRIAAEQVKVRTQDVAVSTTSDVHSAKQECNMASAYLLERKLCKRTGATLSNPTICTLPVVLDLMHKDSLAGAADRAAT
jgi:hypothetical protein